MYDFEKFKPSAFKNKYDIVFAKDKSRTTYGELYNYVCALYNAFSNMSISGSALILCDDGENIAKTCLALSKLGVKRVIADAKISGTVAKKLVKKHSPSVVFIQSEYVKKLAPFLLEEKVVTVVTYGVAEGTFPAQFCFEELCEKNDFVLISDYESTSETEFEAEQDFTLPKLENYNLKNGVFIDIPPFCQLYSSLLSQIIYEGGKCVFFEKNTAKMHKKAGTCLVITDKSKETLYKDFTCDVFVTLWDSVRVGESFIDTVKLSDILSDFSGASVTVTYNGAVINVLAVFPENTYFEDVQNSEEIISLKKLALDLLSPYDKKKTITVKKLR